MRRLYTDRVIDPADKTQVYAIYLSSARSETPQNKIVVYHRAIALLLYRVN